MCGPLNTTAVNESRLTHCKLVNIVFFLYLKNILIKDISEISMNVKQEVSLFVVVVSFCC